MLCYESDCGIVLSDDEIAAVFDYRTFELFEIDPDTLPAQLEKPIAALPHNDEVVDRPAMLPLILAGGSSMPSAKINRLTLNISNACNLWCSYCYADHGHYHAERSFMEPDHARAIVRRVLESWRSMETIHFFGGEPLMNIAAIDAVGEECRRLVAEGRLARMPRFVATTNGTISTAKVIETLKRWDIHLTVSWDGPRTIQEAQRPMVGKGSSFDRLKLGIARFDKAGIAYEFETTYSRRHLDAGVSVVDLLEFLHTQSRQRTFHLAPVSLPPDPATAHQQGIFDEAGVRDSRQDVLPVEPTIAMFRAAARMTVDNLFTGEGPLLAFAHDITLQILERRRGRKYCPAFFDQLSIAADGTVFPCFMFIGDSAFEMGNIMTDSFPNPRSISVLRHYFEEFGSRPTGTDAWYGSLAGGCIASDYLTGNSLAFRSMLPMFAAIVEECLIGIVRNSKRIDTLEASDTAAAGGSAFALETA